MTEPATQPRIEWPLLLLIFLWVALAVVLYPRLPARVPVHWNLAGQVDRYGPKLTGVFGPPLGALVLYFLLVFLPKLDPLRSNYQRFAVAYRTIRWVMVFFFFALGLVTLAAGLGYPVSSTKLMVRLALGLLFIVFGNLLPRLQRTWFVGIRTPWTLSDDEVWRQTHRLGGYLWVTAGVLSIPFALAQGFWNEVFFVVFAILVLYPVPYSYFVYRRLRG